MINPYHRRPRRRAMAILTQVVGLDMLTVFAGSGRAIVATRATAGHGGMIKYRRRPGITGVAVITGVAAGNVVGRLAGGD